MNPLWLLPLKTIEGSNDYFKNDRLRKVTVIHARDILEKNMIKNSVGINPFLKGKQSANACEKVYN